MNSNFKILIVEDEALIAEYIKEILQKYGYTNIVLAHNKAQAIKELENNTPCLALLDIRMKNELDGIDIANYINEKLNVLFAFITSHADKEIIENALKTKPIGYITKPIKPVDIFAITQLALLNYTDNKQEFVLIKDGYDSVKLFFDKILFAESDGNYIHMHCSEKKYTLRNSLDWLLEQLPQTMFQRTHRSFLVNITKITRTTPKSVFINNIEIPVSRANKDILM